jgi:hypothetical protein
MPMSLKLNKFNQTYLNSSFFNNHCRKQVLRQLTSGDGGRHLRTIVTPVNSKLYRALDDKWATHPWDPGRRPDDVYKFQEYQLGRPRKEYREASWKTLLHDLLREKNTVLAEKTS